MDAEEIIKAVSAEPTLDELMRRDPRHGTPEELREWRMQIVMAERERRAAWEAKKRKQEERRERREAEEDDGE